MNTRAVVRSAAVLCLAVGVAVGLLGAYKVIDPFAAARQRALASQLAHDWARPPVSGASVRLKGPAPHASICVPPPERLRPGQPFARITIPRFGRHWRFTVVQGTTLVQLALGPGHITGTPLPGRLGNSGIAAHDVTAGNPFEHLQDLVTGNIVVITTRYCVTTFRVYRPSYRVLYTDTLILRPHTRYPRMITLITCWPVGVLSFVQHRTIVQATETGSVAR